MIPDIGLMVGAYIITRTWSLITRTGDRAESSTVKFLGVITVVVTALCVADLMLKGGSGLGMPGIPGYRP